MTITLQLPHPPRCLAPNWRGHWKTRSDARLHAHELVRAEAERVLADLGIEPPRWAKAHYVATWFHVSPQRPDYGNAIASFKAYEDGIADAGIIINDKHLRPEVRFERCERMPRVEITIQEEI